MDICQLYASIISELHDDLKACRARVKDCPFYVHIIPDPQSAKGVYIVCFSTKESLFGTPVHGDKHILSMGYIRILPEIFQRKIMVEINIQMTSKNLDFGSEHHARGDYSMNPYDWSWRYEKSIVQCDAGLIWNLLERCVDFKSLNEEMVTQVIED